MARILKPTFPERKNRNPPRSIGLASSLKLALEAAKGKMRKQLSSMPTTELTAPPAKPKLLEGVTGYHWLVLFIAAGGWLFDCMGQRIFVLAREPAFRELLGSGANDALVKNWGGWATFTLMVGWGTGGILFGMMSDRMGRV